MLPVSTSVSVLPLYLYVIDLASSCKLSLLHGDSNLSAVLLTLPVSETIIITTVRSSTGKRFTNLIVSSAAVGVTANDVKFVILERILAACSMVLSNSLIFA